MIRQVIGHDDFRPMDHRRFDELQGMFTQSQLVPFLDGDIAVRHGMTEELFKELEGLRLADNLGVRIFFQESQSRAGMVRFHMLEDEVVQFTAFEQVFDVFQEFVTARFIHGIDDTSLFVIDEIGIVRNAFGNRENPFKQFRTEIVAAHPINTIFNFFYTMHTDMTSLKSTSSIHAVMSILIPISYHLLDKQEILTRKKVN